MTAACQDACSSAYVEAAAAGLMGDAGWGGTWATMSNPTPPGATSGAALILTCGVVFGAGIWQSTFATTARCAAVPPLTGDACGKHAALSPDPPHPPASNEVSTASTMTTPRITIYDDLPRTWLAAGREGNSGVRSMNMLDTRRTLLRRLGTVVGLAVTVFGLYRAVTPPANHCPQSTPQHGYACDVGPPSHPHFLLWLLVAAAGLAVLIASRHFLAYFQE